MPIRTYSTVATLSAPAPAVWSILTDAAGYAAWNPEILGVEGRFAGGERIRARVLVKAGRGKTAVRSVPLRVTAFEPPSAASPGGRMEWRGGLPLGLFTGVRVLSVRPLDGTNCEFRMDLRMSGPLLGMVLMTVGDRQAEIDSFSAALKARAEGRA